MHKCCSSWRHDLQSRDKKVVLVFAHFYLRYRWHFEVWLLMSPSGKLHCVLIETFSHSSRRADWFRPISHWRGRNCVVAWLNHCPPSSLQVKVNSPRLWPVNLFTGQSLGALTFTCKDARPLYKGSGTYKKSGRAKCCCKHGCSGWGLGRGTLPGGRLKKVT